MTTGAGYGTGWGTGQYGSGASNVQLVVISGIATSEAFGALSLAAGTDIVISGIATAEAFGALVALTGGSVVPASIATSEAFGVARLGQVLYPGGISSTEAFGAPQFNDVVYPSGIGSVEAFGALVVELGSDILLGGIGSAEAFGALRLAQAIAPTGIGSAEAFGGAELDLTVYPSGIGSGELFGSARVAHSMSPVGIGSLETFGALALELGEDILLGGIGSLEAFGAVALSRDVVLSGIASEQAFGALAVAKVVRPLSIGSLEAFGLLRLTNDGIAPAGIPSGEAFGLLALADYGRLRVVNAGASGPMGPIDGGTAVTLYGAVFNTGPCSDDFQSGVLLSAWALATTGSGQLTPRSNDLLFDTGSTPGSAVSLTRLELVGDVDASFDLSTVTLSGNGLATSVLFSGQLFVDAGNNFTLALVSSAGRTFIRIMAVASGSTVVNQVVPLLGGAGVTVGGGSGGGVMTMRFIRLGARVLGFLNGTQYVDATWVDSDARLVYGVSNDGGLASRVVASATGYRRQALVTFGDSPVVGYTLTSAALVVASTPAAAEPGVVDISATGCGPRETIPGGFTYTIGPRLVLREAPYEDPSDPSAPTAVTVLNDPTLGGGGV